MKVLILIAILLSCAIVGYLFGSIPNGVIISKLFFKKDIRDYGSHNSGGTNVGRVLGKKAGVIVIILDMLKLIIPFIVAIYLFEYNVDIKSYINPNYNELSIFGEGNTLNQLAYFIVPLFAMIGHAYPIFAKFRGGKIVSTYAGFDFTTTYLSFPIMVSTFFITLKAKKYVSLASIFSGVVSGLFAVITFIVYACTFKDHGQDISNYMMWFFFGPRCCIYYPIFALLCTGLLIFKHKENIKRIANGTESKIKWMK